MSIDKAHAIAEVERLEHLEYFPKGDLQFIEDLAEILAESKTPEIARAVVSQWLRERRDRPTPADIYDRVWEHNAAADASARAFLPDCPECGGIGQQTGARMVRGELLSYARICPRCQGSGKVH